jgi:hypothetical protein
MVEPLLRDDVGKRLRGQEWHCDDDRPPPTFKGHGPGTRHRICSIAATEEVQDHT